jgi:putative DNA methylase
LAQQQDVVQLDRSNAIAISTDPPYYDNIGYADLSDYFYVWLRKSLQPVYPELFSTLLVPKAPELVATPFRFDGSKARARQFFEDGMVQTFTNLRRFAHPDYPLTVYYAFKQQEGESDAEGDMLDEDAPTITTPQHASTGWETMLSGLMQAGFSIVGTYPVRTEMGTRMVGRGTNALASSIVLVLRPRPAHAPLASRAQFVAALRAELPRALHELQRSSIAPVDMAQASIGPGIKIYSRYSEVREANGKLLTLRTALKLINDALDEYLAHEHGDLDLDTRFAVAWFERFGFAAGSFGEADVLARANNASVEGVVRAGVVEAKGGKVRLIRWNEYDPSNIPGQEWDPRTDNRLTIWEATHHLIERLHHHGETGSAKLLEKLPVSVADEARQLAYRLYNICERKGWAEIGRDYNALVVSWGGIGQESARLREQFDSGRSTEQMKMDLDKPPL